MNDWPIFQPVFNSYTLVAVVTVGLLLLLLIGPTIGSLSRAKRVVLIVLRVCLILLLLVFMLCPAWTTSSKRKQSATLLVMFDSSLSMQQPHVDKKSRWQAQLEILRESEPILQELSRRLEVKIYAYDYQEPQLITVEEGKISFPDLPQGKMTDIGWPLLEMVRTERGKRLAGVIVLGDGAQTAFNPRVELNQAIEELVALQYPLYTVAFGRPDDVGRGGDVAVEYFPDQYSVFVKNELVVKGMLRLRGYVNKDIAVELVAEDKNGNSKVVGQTSVRARQDGEQLEAAISFVPTEVGQFKLTLRAAPQDDEAVVENNQLVAFLTVLEGGLRVLYLEGEMRTEQMFLRRSLDASQDIQLDFQWIDHRRRDSWPIDLIKTIGKTKYDVVILGDLDSAALYRRNDREKNLQALSSLVEKGQGFIMLGGYHSFGPGGYQHTPLVDLLPIRMGQFERQDFGARISEDLHQGGPLTLTPTGEHFLTSLASADRNKQVWQALPPLEGANKFTGVKNASGVAVRLVSQNGDPILVSGQYGDGRVLAMAGDSTWRWWMQGHKDEHRRFWRQVVLWLAQRDGKTKDLAWIKLAQRRFRPDSRVEFSAGVRNDAGDALRDAQISVVVVSPDGSRTDVSVQSAGENSSGWFDKTELAGQYLVEMTAQIPGKTPVTAQSRFQVFDTNPELTNTAANPDQLARLANLTSQFGGRLVPPEEFSNLLREIQNQPLETEVEVRYRWQLAGTWWDSWLFFSALVLLLGTEWTLRKAWGLV